MLKNIKWVEDDVYSLVLREGLYTLVQMRKNYILQFFDIQRATDEWAGTNLDDVPTLFFKFVAPKGLSRMFCRLVSKDEVVRSSAPIQTKFLSMDLSQAPDYAAKLVELTDDFDVIGGKELTERLSAAEDVDKIYRYELAGSEGNSDRLSRRLIRYFDTGVNWDDSKEFIFKGISPPPPYYGKSS